MRALLLVLCAGLSTACTSHDHACDWTNCVDAVTPPADTVPTDATGMDASEASGQVVALTLTPMDPVLVSESGALPAVRFDVTGSDASGDPIDVTGRLRFSLADPSLGMLDDTGLFVSNGTPGQTTVRVQLSDSTSVTASTTLSVHRHDQIVAAGTPPDAPAQFAAATPGTDAPPVIAYPLANAVMPRNVPAPPVQWNPGVAEDGSELYHIRFGRPDAVIDAYFASWSGFTDSFQPDPMAWRAFAETDVGTPITLVLEVLHAGHVVRAASVSFRTVDAIAAGAVYYWQLPAPGSGIANGRIERLDTANAARSDFLPSGSCHGCHAVSQDGTRMMNNAGGFDLTTSPPATVFTNAAFIDGRSYDPTGRRIAQSGLQLLDAMTGATVPGVSPPTGGVYPEWSRDGTFIAYVTGTDASPAGERGGTANLMTVATLPSDGFGTPTVLHMGSSLPNGGRDWHPTISPNSRWIAFQHGDDARSTDRGALYLIARDGGTPVELANVNAGLLVNYRPHFSPIDSGGYFWLVYSSSRPYGNSRAGAVDGTRNQLWVTAVHDHPDGSTDPSEVPYWLPGQDVHAYNLSAYWAPAPCRVNGMRCSSGDECCSTQCDPDSAGTTSCAPPHGHCAMRGETCGSTADCCTDGPMLVCSDAHVCDLPPPG